MHSDIGTGDLRIFEHSGYRMVYERSGLTDPDSPVIVLVHGLGMGRGIVARLAWALGAEATVYTLDLPGFGDSPEPPSPMDVAGSGDLLADFTRSLGAQDPLLVGHSMGAQVVAEALARHPSLSGRAVLVAPVVNPAERRVRTQVWRFAQDLARESAGLLVMGAFHYSKAGPRRLLRTLRRTVEYRLEETLPHIEAETLVLSGDADLLCPQEWIEQVCALLPSGRLRIAPYRGHEAMIRTPEPVAGMLLEFLRETSGPERLPSDRPSGRGPG